ncbi:MAG TPA: alanine--tRNA ligase-related protein [Candidatus Paceibacterota bacterium]|nr:alanine--tRNA ligase-related protein [Candidatus Paceibacterota bacterium]
MTINEIRSKYLKFFQARGHTIIPSASLVPQNDPTTLFTGSGMQPLIPYLLGEPHPKGNRLVDSQKSFRAEDIDEVGDNRHTTFFEMLGNWSLGDYFKKDQLPWFFGFLTDEVGIDANRLYVTVFIGDENNGVPRDTESAGIWKELFANKGIDAKDVVIGSEEDGYRLGMQDGRIFYYDAKKNWWSRAGTPEKMPAGEPGGPDSEVFYDFGTPHDEKYGAQCHPNCDCGRFLEIGNSVFMQYIKKEDGSFALLPKANVDFGGGLERIAAASEKNPDVFSIDVFSDMIALLEHFSGKSYNDSRYRRSFRIIADHMRAATMMLGDGVRPSNTERGYVLRRLIRRASQHALKIGAQQDQEEESLLNRCAIIVIEKYKQAYTELASEEAYETITKEIWNEEKQFSKTLEHGMKEFEKVAATGHIEPSEAFTLFTTYGFPFEMTLELATERGIDVDVEGFKTEMKRHQELSRAGSEQKFKGGLADTSEKTTRLHTAHHLLLKALQLVLGAEVHQRGSNITQERLRIDFSYGTKMTKEQIAEAERIVNEKIKEELPVIRSTLPKEKAETLGAEHEFGAKYPDVVSVYSVGPKGATEKDPMFADAFSIEFCGGPHVSNTRELTGVFKIQKEEAVASGIRRIKAVIL